MKKYIDKQTCYHTNKKGEVVQYKYTYLRDYDSKKLRNKRLIKKIKTKKWLYISKKLITNEEELLKLSTNINGNLYFTPFSTSKILNIQYSKFLKWIDSDRIPHPPFKIEDCSNYKHNCKFYPDSFIFWLIEIFTTYYKYNKVYDLRYKRSKDLKLLIFSKYEEILKSYTHKRIDNFSILE